MQGRWATAPRLKISWAIFKRRAATISALFAATRQRLPLLRTKKSIACRWLVEFIRHKNFDAAKVVLAAGREASPEFVANSTRAGNAGVLYGERAGSEPGFLFARRAVAGTLYRLEVCGRHSDGPGCRARSRALIRRLVQIRRSAARKTEQCNSTVARCTFRRDIRPAIKRSRNMTENASSVASRRRLPDDPCAALPAWTGLSMAGTWQEALAGIGIMRPNGSGFGGSRTIVWRKSINTGAKQQRSQEEMKAL